MSKFLQQLENRIRNVLLISFKTILFACLTSKFSLFNFTLYLKSLLIDLAINASINNKLMTENLNSK